MSITVAIIGLVVTAVSAGVSGGMTSKSNKENRMLQQEAKALAMKQRSADRYHARQQSRIASKELALNDKKLDDTARMQRRDFEYNMKQQEKAEQEQREAELLENPKLLQKKQADNLVANKDRAERWRW